jgi:hypothetical protein
LGASPSQAGLSGADPSSFFDWQVAQKEEEKTAKNCKRVWSIFAFKMRNKTSVGKFAMRTFFLEIFFLLYAVFPVDNFTLKFSY